MAAENALGLELGRIAEWLLHESVQRIRANVDEFYNREFIWDPDTKARQLQTIERAGHDAIRFRDVLTTDPGLPDEFFELVEKFVINLNAARARIASLAGTLEFGEKPCRRFLAEAAEESSRFQYLDNLARKMKEIYVDHFLNGGQ